MCNLFKALKSISLQIISLIHQLNQRVLGILGVRLPQEHTDWRQSLSIQESLWVIKIELALGGHQCSGI